MVFTDPILDESDRKTWGYRWYKVVRGSSVWTSDSEIQLLGGAVRRGRGLRGVRQDQGGLRISLSLPCNSTMGVVE